MVNRTILVKISSIVGGGICVSSDDGHKVHDVIHEIITSGDRAQISFASVTRMTTAFLNSAVGQLYGEFSEDFLKSRLAPPVDSEPWQLARLKLVVDRAKMFFSADEAIRAAVRRASDFDD